MFNNMSDTTKSTQNDPGEFFNDYIVNEFICGRTMMAVIAAEKPKKVAEPKPAPVPVELKIEVPFSESPIISSPSKSLSLSPPPKLPSPKAPSPEPIKIMTPVKPDTPP